MKKKEDVKERQAKLTALDVKVLKACLTGKYLRVSFSSETLKSSKDALGAYPNKQLAKLQKLGVIDGIVPVLTEKGQKVIEAFELLNEDLENEDLTIEKMFKED